MKSLPVLIRREFWEHRSAFVVLPAVITFFFLAMMSLVFMVAIADIVDMGIDLDDRINIDMSILLDHHERPVVEQQFSSGNQMAFMLSRLANMSELRRKEIVNHGLQTLSVPLVIVLWGVIFFYLLTCLHGERRDRSILFWKSMPVSDAMIVISKLVSGLLVVPLVYLLGIAVLQLSALILLTLASLDTEISAIETVWGSADIVSNWYSYLSAILFYSLWSLPFFAWLLVVSAFARSLPLAWALGVPFALAVCERIFTDQTVVADWMRSHVIPLGFLTSDHSSFSSLVSRLFSLQMLSAVIVGAGLVLVGIWFRGKAEEI